MVGWKCKESTKDFTRIQIVLLLTRNMKSYIFQFYITVRLVYLSEDLRVL